MRVHTIGSRRMTAASLSAAKQPTANCVQMVNPVKFQVAQLENIRKLLLRSQLHETSLLKFWNGLPTASPKSSPTGQLNLNA